MSLSPYPSFETVIEQARSLGTPEVYGASVEGRELVAVHVGGSGPAAVITAGLHGIEYIGVQVALEAARGGALAGLSLWLLPVLNPDGYVRTWQADGDGPVRLFRKNARGVDLNRNFPMPRNARPSRLPFAGGQDPDSPTYRGPHALSEPESAALVAWMDSKRPIVSANCHSFMGSLIPARVWDWDSWWAYHRLCTAFRAGQGRRFGYRRLSTPLFDVFTGELEDWQHHELGCLSVCIESFALRESVQQHLRAPTGFWRFNPRDPTPTARRDAAGVRALLASASGMPRAKMLT